MNDYEIKQLLDNAIKKDKVLHSYMFVGSKLTQKQELATEFAKNILCSNKDIAPCEQCKSCVEINSSNHPDFKKIAAEEDGDTIKIEQIRNLQADIIKKPIVSDKKVYIIKNSDKMTVRCTKLFIKNIRRATRVRGNNITSRK